MIRPTRIQIDSQALTGNLKLLKSWTGGSSFFCPMVKANAYGHGDVLVAKIVEASGTASALGVALYEEGVELRKAGVRLPVLVFAPLTSGAVKAAKEFQLTPVAGRFADLEALKDEALALHLKFNTGMNRLGFDQTDLAPLKEWLKKHPRLKVLGTCTHLSHGEEAHESEGPTAKQIQRLHAMSEGFPGIRHAHKSASLVASHEHGVVVDPALGSRPGISIYGLPCDGRKVAREMKAVLKWSTELIHFHRLEKGEAVGYGARWAAKQPSLIGIVPVGYGDGYPRALSNKGEMLFRGQRVPVVGSVCMDYTLIDLTAQTGSENPRVGEEIVLIGRQGHAEMTAGELADKVGTIAYEIVTGISRRVPREVI